jgi:integrase
VGKRGNGEGTITRRKNGGWMAQYYVYTVGGRKRKTLYGKTRKEVAKKLTGALSDREGGLVFDAEGLKLEEYLNRWLEDSVKDTVRNTTYERYEQICRTHIVPLLGGIKLKALSPTHVRGLYKEKLSYLSPRTVQYIHVTLHKALKQAVRDGLIPRNATEAVKPPQVRREEIRPLTAEQVKMLLDASSGDRLEALYVLAVHTGLRQRELLGLKWDDIDLEAGTLQVRRALTTAKGGPRLAAPKTKGSRRRVSLTGVATDALKAHLKRQLEQIDRAGSLWQEHGLVFASETGAPRPPRPHLAPVQAAPRAREATGEDPLPRPQAHVRHLAAHEERQPQGRLGDAGSLQHRHHPRHLLAGTPQHAGQRRPSPRRSPPLARCSTVAVNGPGQRAGAFSFCLEFSQLLQAFYSCAGGGTRTHTARRPPDFESGASTNSATPARQRCANYTNASRRISAFGER